MSATIASPSVVEPDAMYSLDEAQRRMGWGKAGMRAARRRGLAVKYAGRRGYVLGRSLIKYVEEHGRTEK